MERDQNGFSHELLQMMREEEQKKFLDALENGESWRQLYNIRNNIKKLNNMIEAAEQAERSGQDTGFSTTDRNSDETGPRDPSTH